LPVDHPRTALGNGRGGRDSIFLSAELAEALNEFSRREGVTPFMTHLTAYKTLLYKYCRQEDIVVGTPSAGRNRREVEKLIGFFVNMLVLRTQVEPRASFAEMVRKEKAVCLAAYAHQEISF